MAGMLYLVPTPIGNLGDISQRCRETLEQADFIAAEDTRVSLKLLNHLGIKKASSATSSTTRLSKAKKLSNGFWQVKPALWFLMQAVLPFPTPARIW